jgi:murein L,D-transpeptidase YcbB/YkuD
MMNRDYKPFLLFKTSYFFAFLLFFLVACDNEHVQITAKEIVEKPEEINVKAEDIIQGTLKDILKNGKDIEDSIKIKNANIVQYLYDQQSFQPLWSSQGSFASWGDSLYSLIDSSRNYGLFPKDYYHAKLVELKKELILDTVKENKLDAAKWAYSDLLLTSAFVQVVKDLSKGRLLPDSILARDSSLTPDFFANQLAQFRKEGIDSFTAHLEPKNTGYAELKKGLHRFLAKAKLKHFTFVETKDSLLIPDLLFKRLSEEDSLPLQVQARPDSLSIAAAIKKYQKRKGQKVDGKISASLINKLNDNDNEKFIRIAITMDKFKLLPPMPQQYIWVNIPSYNLQLKDSDTIVLISKVVVGKPNTKTPLITSAITDMITYPKWHIPESIIKKDILPGLKRDPGYTLRKGYTLFDKDGKEVDPYTINWSKYKEGIPYKVVQGSGDENALGVIKFNFPNDHSVYLHDTNQRYLFSKTSRALSHGCVRVQAWEELAHFILRNDSTYSDKAIPIDTVSNWLALKEKHVIPVRKKLPLFIRYFACEGKGDHVVFYEDVYGEDRLIREKIFSDK